jgi:hypothetical protein
VLVLLPILIPAALASAISVAVAVLVHETSELLAVANRLRVTRALSGTGKLGSDAEGGKDDD